jgi:hypothetical protein
VISRSRYDCGATVCQSCCTTAGTLAVAWRFRVARERSRGLGGVREAPSLAARSAASFPGTCAWPGTQRIRTAPGLVVGSLFRVGQLSANSQKDWNVACEEPLDGPSKRIATSRLSRNIQRSLVWYEAGLFRAALAPRRAASASASKTSFLCPREKAPRISWTLAW